jgi:hypothetical protein
VSQSSAESGQPWLKTIGSPEPQSLKKIPVPSVVVIVGMLYLLCAWYPALVGLGCADKLAPPGMFVLITRFAPGRASHSRAL